MDEGQILAVIVTESNVVKNKMIHMEHGLDHETILKMNILLNSSLKRPDHRADQSGHHLQTEGRGGIHSEVVSRVLDAVAEAISQEEDLEIYTSGATNFFRYPELSDSEKASELISTFEEKRSLASLMGEEEANPDEHGIQVYIGNETPVPTMKDCSVVTASTSWETGCTGASVLWVRNEWIMIRLLAF